MKKEPRRNGEPDQAAAKRLLNSLIDGAPAATLRAGGHTAKLYAVTIDARTANAVLDTSNWRNRSVRQKKVAQHAKRMAASKWRLQNALLFSEGGELLDGQHRLLGVKESGCEVPFIIQVVAQDVSDEANLAVDAGVPRNLVDFLHFHGVHNAQRVAPVLVYERNARISRSPFQESRGEKEDYLRLFTSMQQATFDRVFEMVPKGFHNQFGVQRAIVDWVALQLMQVSDSDAKLFFELIQNPSSLSDTDPPYVISRRLMDNAVKSARGGWSPPPVEQAVLILKAWNAYYESRKLNDRALQYKPREDFPLVAGQR